MASWPRVKEVLGLALEAAADQRAAVLDAHCAGDAELRAEVESLLAAEADAGLFIATPAVDATEDDEHDPHIGSTIGAHVIDRCLGRGGMGAVYLAHHTGDFSHSVAIKMIRRGMDSELVVRRFRHERQMLASLNHPHIARLFDGGTTSAGLPYFVMEYIDGAPIDRYADSRRLNVADRMRLCLAVFDAVQHAHDRQIIHRDLKPGNVLVTANGEVKLLDFGISKWLGSGSDGDSTMTSLARPMTPEYASPEQIRGGTITPATDVYALGLLMYELLTGHRPFRFHERTPEEISNVVCEQEPERPSTAIGRVETTTYPNGATESKTPITVSETREGSPEALRSRLSGPLDDIVMKALRKVPEARYQTVAALADDVRRWLDALPVSAGRDAWRYQASQLLRRHGSAIGIAAAVIVAIAITAVIASRSATPAMDTVTLPQQSATRPSVAVAGFTNLSQRPEDAWLSTAMVEMLTTDLAGDGQLRVVPAERTSRAIRELGAGTAFTDDHVDRLRSALSTQYVVIGSFATSGEPAARRVRIDVKVMRPDGDPLAVSGSGSDAELFTLMASAGRDLRERLGLERTTEAATQASRAAFPANLDATRLYAEGVARLRELDAVRAQELLEKAASLEPSSPMIHMALASAWTALGYDRRATESAQRAFDASKGLGRETRLTVEGNLYSALRDWPKAIEVYRTLSGFFADNVEYGLRLAEAQTAGGRHKDALATIEAVRATMPQPDPRLDIVESQAASALSDYPRELASIQRARQHADAHGMRLLSARAYLFEGRGYFNQGKITEAEAALEKARELFAAGGDRSGVASALNSLATVLSDRDDSTLSQKMYEESLAASESIGDRRGASAALNNLGILLKDMGKYEEARRAHERALALRREIADRNWIAISLNNIGVVLFEQDQFREASKYYKESLELARELGDKRSQVRALHNLAVVERESGNLAAARKEIEESLVMRTELGDKRGQVAAHVELGISLLAQGELARARQAQEEAIKLSIETKLLPGEAQGRYQLGEIALVAGDLAESRKHHEQALAMRTKLNEPRTIAESEAALATLALEEGRIDEALQRAARVEKALSGSPAPMLAVARLINARVRIARNDVTGAEQQLAASRGHAARTERISLRSQFTLVEAQLNILRGQPEVARAQLDGLREDFRKTGMVIADFERRLVRLLIDRGDAAALERDARAKGAGLIANRAKALLSDERF
jgi:serine/threonine protein kinase/tetratricopeptide (TPR) repeat protein/TolB-like protein